MTLVAGIVLLYAAIVAMNCRVFRGMHKRDEEIEQMMRTQFASGKLVMYKKTVA